MILVAVVGQQDDGGVDDIGKDRSAQQYSRASAGTLVQRFHLSSVQQASEPGLLPISSSPDPAYYPPWVRDGGPANASLLSRAARSRSPCSMLTNAPASRTSVVSPLGAATAGFAATDYDGPGTCSPGCFSDLIVADRTVFDLPCLDELIERRHSSVSLGLPT